MPETKGFDQGLFAEKAALWARIAPPETVRAWRDYCDSFEEEASTEGLEGVEWAELAHDVAFLDQCARLWGRTRQTFVFDEELAAALDGTDVAGAPLSTVRRLPFPALFVEQSIPFFPEDRRRFERYEPLGEGWDGYFVLAHAEGGGDCFHVVLVASCPDGEYLHQRFKLRYDSTLGETMAGWEEADSRGVAPPSATLACKVLAQVLYLCAAGSDVERRGGELRRADRRRRQRRAEKGLPPEGDVWQVGRRVGAALAASSGASGAQGRESAGSGRKRFHLRRAHFTHVWVGRGPDKQRELRWVQACLVGDPGDLDAPETVHRVKGAQA